MACSDGARTAATRNKTSCRELVSRQPGTGKDEYEYEYEWCRELVSREPGTGKDEYEYE
jgi:hypothetical protein